MPDTRSRCLGLLGLALALCGLAPPARADLDLLVVSQNSGRVIHYDGATGAYQGEFIAPGTGGLSLTSSLELGADGLLYAAWAGGVLRFDASTGAFIDTFVAGLPSAVAQIAFGPDGNLYGTFFTSGPDLVFKADGTTGAVIDYFGGGGLDLASGITFGPDGNLYVGSFATSQVMRFDPATGVFIDVFATVPIAGTAGNLSGVRFGPDGNLYVALSNGGDDVYRFDGTTGAPLGPFIPAADPHPASPRRFDWGPDGNLYVSGANGSDVIRYDGTTGAFIDYFARNADGPRDVLFAPEPIFSTLPPQPPLVATTSGPVQGLLAQGNLAYLGIPYAEAPTGALRWKRPVRKAASATPLDARGFGPACPQQNNPGNEDCLKISLWRPENPSATPLPVLFYIHGGGLTSGSVGGWTDGTDLARRQNLIVVEAQYRLGALGFFGLPELAAEDPDGSTGNYGFLDQLEALRWVRDNIAAFGGDPNQVTIAGESAGGWSVCALMASPLSDGLFRAGIVQSAPQCMNARPLTVPAGSPLLADPFFGTTIYARSDAVAAGAGCDASLGQQLQLDCLRAQPAASLVQALAAQPPNALGEVPANPAIDGYVLPEQPLGLLRQGAADQRPLMIGTVANESTLFTQGLAFGLRLYDPIVRATVGDTRADAFLPLYPASSYSSPPEALRTLFDDGGFVCPSLDTADAITAGGSTAWVYQLTFPPTYGPTSTYAGLRTFHTLDLFYLFRTYALLAPQYGIQTDADDATLSDSIQEAWGSFARSGVPSTAPAWPVYAPAVPGDLASVSVLNFDVPNTTTTGTAFRSGRCAALAPVVDLLDRDRDIATYDEDNCPNATNTSQADASGDGIGDACQCGDVDDDGFVTGFDGMFVKRAALKLAPFGAAGVSALPAPQKCDVNGGATGDPVYHCSGVDGTLIRRASLGLRPGIAQACVAADGS